MKLAGKEEESGLLGKAMKLGEEERMIRRRTGTCEGI